jgi:hypothetical protein
MKRKLALKFAFFKRAHVLLTQRGIKPQLEESDNEASAALQQFTTSVNVDYQLAPPHTHRRNAAERDIRTFENHFITGLYSVNKNFPLYLWDRRLLVHTSSPPSLEATSRLSYQPQTVQTRPTPRCLRLQPDAASTVWHPFIGPRKVFRSWYPVPTCRRRLVPRPRHQQTLPLVPLLDLGILCRSIY